MLRKSSGTRRSLRDRDRRQPPAGHAVAADHQRAGAFGPGVAEAAADQLRRRGRHAALGDEVQFVHEPVVAFGPVHLDRPVVQVVAQRGLAERPGHRGPRRARRPQAARDRLPVGPLHVRGEAEPDAEGERVGEKGGARGSIRGAGREGALSAIATTRRSGTRAGNRLRARTKSLLGASNAIATGSASVAAATSSGSRARAALLAIAAQGEQGQGPEAERDREKRQLRTLGLADDVPGLPGEEGRGDFPDAAAEREVGDPLGVAAGQLVGGERRQQSADEGQGAEPGEAGAAPPPGQHHGLGEQREEGEVVGRQREAGEEPPEQRRCGGRRRARRERSRAARARRAAPAARRRAPPASTRGASG